MPPLYVGPEIRPMRYHLQMLVCGSGLALASCTSFGTGSYFRTGVRTYAGEGEIRDTSQPALFFATRGYRIDLPEFPLDRRLEHSYVLKGIPVINKTAAGIFFELPQGPTSASTGRAKASFHASLVDGEGRPISHFGGPLNSFTWSGSSLYQHEGSFFQPKSDEEYRLHVKFDPGNGIGEGHGRIYIQCAIGGS